METDPYYLQHEKLINDAWLENQCYCELCCSEGHCGCETCDEPCDC